MNKIGFIGMGNMAIAIAGGLVDKNVYAKENIYAYAPNQDKLKKNSEIIGFNPVVSLDELVDICDTVIIACKPYQIDGVLDQVGSKLSGKNLISVAAGWTYDTFAAKTQDVKIQCIMPNTPAMVGEGVFLFEETNSLDDADKKQLRGMFEALGVVVDMPTGLMGIGGAVSGCGPAFMDLVMEAYADAAVKYGIARNTAYKLIAQTMLGSAKLQLETGKHPGVLKDEVCSPNGTTIRGVAALEENGLRNACIKSIDVIMESKNGNKK